MLSRRDILKAALISSLPTLAAPAFAKQPRRFADIHCHFFNAADLPIRGFLQRVVLSDYSAEQTQAGSSVSLSVWKGLAARLADVALKPETPTAAAELACLKGAGACRGFASAATEKSAAAPGDGGSANAIQKGIADALKEHYRARGAQLKSNSPSAGEGDTNDADNDAFVDFVLDEMEKSGTGVPGASSGTMKSLGSTLEYTADEIAKFLTSGKSAFSRYFAWAEVLTDYRENIIEAYYSLYDPQHTRAVLTCPALIDFSYWLDDNSTTALKEQVELMALLSLRQPRPMHGFAAFDPLREIRRKPEDPSPLAIVQEAVMKHGFLGAKLYSPMGFKPTDNAAHGLIFPAYAALGEAGFGAALDKALDSLYAWCEANEVPILAHTTDSQSAGPEFAARAEPKFWEKVLIKYPKLKLNLAHFGNFSQALAQTGEPMGSYSKTWEYEIAGYIKGGHFPNIYADISYFWWVLDGSTDKNRILAVKKLFGKYFEVDPNCERLMFGTDWNMAARAKGASGYVDNVEAFFRGLGLSERQLDNLFYKNALHFLGLDRPSKALSRISAFYKAAGKPVPNFA